MRPTDLLPATLTLLSAAAGAQSFEAYDHLGGPGDEAGTCVANVGDVDGDGFDDQAIGAPSFDLGTTQDVGRVLIHSGRTGALLRVHEGDELRGLFGLAIDGIGDVDGDGCSEYLVGAPWADNGPAVNGGRVYVYSGKTGNLLVQYASGVLGGLLGVSVCGPGDLTGDGVPDWVLGTSGFDGAGGTLQNSGRVQLYDGATYAPLWFREGPAAEALLGDSMDVVGDLNGDGRNELVVGAPGESVILVNNGRGYVLDGATGATLFSRIGASPGGALGRAVAGVGDVNGDGVPDVGFGEPLADTNGTDSGRVAISSGAPPYASLGEVFGPAGVRTGTSLCGLGDADGDGRDDFAVGMPRAGFFSLFNVGWVYLISGATMSPYTTLIGEAQNDYFGQALAGCGDLNGDGFGDLIAGSPYNDFGGGNAGKARVFLGEFPTPDVYCTAKLNSQGCLPEIDWQGVPSQSIGDDFWITAEKIVSDVVGVMIWAPAPGATPFGGGTLCLSGSVTRTPGQFSGSSQGVPCTGTFAFHFSQGYMASQGVVAGSDVYAQYWSRDPGFSSPNDINLTDALHFEVRP